MSCPVGAGTAHMWISNGKGGMYCQKCGLRTGPQ